MQLFLLGANYIGEDICSDTNVLSALRVVGYLLVLAKICVPLIIIFMGTLDLYKAIMGGSSDSLSKQVKMLGIRFLIGITIFFVPTLVNLVLDQLNEYNAISEDIKPCQRCMLEPTKC